MKATKIYISIVICLLSYSAVTYAQEAPSANNGVIKKSISVFSVIKVEGSAALTTKDLVLDPRLVEKLDVPSKAEFRKNYQYGDVKADVIFVVTPKKGVKFLNLTQVFDQFNIATKYRGYPILVDRTETENAKNLLINEGAINKVVVDKEKGYVNIITIFHDNYMKFRDEVIKDKHRRLEEIKARGK